MSLSSQTLLDAVEAAITTILAGGVASYSTTEAGFAKQFTKLDLPKLFEERRNLLTAVARERRGSFSVATFRQAR